MESHLEQEGNPKNGVMQEVYSKLQASDVSMCLDRNRFEMIVRHTISYLSLPLTDG